jgi:hypothetical protein
MDVTQRAERVRQQREQFGHVHKGRPLPEELRREALFCWRAIRAQGIGAEAAAARLGLGVAALERWSGGSQALAVLAPVTIEAEPVLRPTLASRPVVHAPHGVRVEGLDVAGVAELLKRLA